MCVAKNALVMESSDSQDVAPEGSTGLVYVTFSTATLSLPLSSFRNWYTYRVREMPWTCFTLSAFK